jgi:transposase
MKNHTPPHIAEPEIAALQAEIAGLRREVAEQAKLLAWYSEQFKLAQQRQYGRKTESFAPGYEQLLLEQNGDVFNEAETAADPTVIEPNIEEIKSYRRKKRTAAESLPGDLPVLEEIAMPLTDEQKVCPKCGGAMHVCGHETRDELVVIPAQIWLRRYITETASCRECAKDATGEFGNSTSFVKSELPKFPIPGSIASAELIAYTMVQKYVMGAPLYRQEKEWERQGILLSRQTMSNWFINAENRLLRPLYEYLWELLLQQDILHADETTLNVLRDPEKTTQTKSYMWFYGSGKYENQQLMLYEWCRSRRQENPQEKLKDYAGFLHVDGYPGYHNLNKNVTIVGCAAHARRKFADIIKAMPKEAQNRTFALESVEYWDKLFEFERRWDADNVTPETRKNLRETNSKPLLNEYYEYLESLNALPKSALGQAVAYSINQRRFLENYMLDGRLELSNNRAERAIKPFVIDRKNFLFSNTPNGAESSATIFSLIETAKVNALDPFKYLTFLLKTAPTLDLTDKTQLEKLLPWNAPETCKSAKPASKC